MNDKQIIKRLTEELEIALAENANLKEQLEVKWISVKDRIPDERCIAYTPNQDEVGKWRIIPKGLFRQAASEASHWMPMPSTKEIEYGQ